MSEKVVITKDQAEALARNYAYTNNDLLKLHARSENAWSDQWSGLNGMDFDTLAKALYIGYEVEPAPEELIFRRYEEAKYFIDICTHKQYHQGMVDAIEMVLRTLKIEIEGIHK